MVRWVGLILNQRGLGNIPVAKDSSVKVVRMSDCPMVVSLSLRVSGSGVVYSNRPISHLMYIALTLTEVQHMIPSQVDRMATPDNITTSGVNEMVPGTPPLDSSSRVVVRANAGWVSCKLRIRLISRESSSPYKVPVV